ncbi:BQ5605_C007g04843 [Microbotryum silenes-dioicae]|uniref:BQ5605_C007g04843 protein n=1 Tax=Microbotryum silenes-dioicae TaxID=796604 RepID=A0A2X0PA72_9BASI|nr:BQ5605_C007g04843 [Microbotryum silenes-dioicae]
MKIHIISLLAVLISSKVNAQGLDENLTNLPDCWTTGTHGELDF